MNTLPSWLQWPKQLLLFIGLLLASHLIYTVSADHHWLMMHEFSHPAFVDMPAEQKQLLATERSHKPLLFLFVKNHLGALLLQFLDLFAVLLLSYGLALLLKMALSFRQLLSLTLLLLLPQTLYQGVLFSQMLFMDWPIQQEFSALNQLTLNALILQLPFHHPLYALACQIQLAPLFGMVLAVVLAVKYFRLSVGYALLLAVLPCVLLWCAKLLTAL